MLVFSWSFPFFSQALAFTTKWLANDERSFNKAITLPLPGGASGIQAEISRQVLIILEASAWQDNFHFFPNKMNAFSSSRWPIAPFAP